jgi:anti-sigma factor ChrR (cupin superfamily)
MAASKMKSKLMPTSVARSPTRVLPDVLPDALAQRLLVELVVEPMPKRRIVAVKKNLLAAVAGERTAKAKIVHATSSVSEKTAALDIVTTRQGEGVWHQLCAGVEVQPLFDDGHTLSWLARFQPRGRLPAHDHVGEEESFVLHGACYLGGQLLNQGDRQFAPDGSHHQDVYSPKGCTLLIRSASRATPHYLSVLSARAR